MVVPESFHYDANTGAYIFKITNFKDTIDVVYKGKTKLQFKEGDNVVLTGYLPNSDIKNRVIATSYITNHSMEVENWQGSNFNVRESSIILN